MNRIAPLTSQSDDRIVSAVFGEIEAAFGMVPNLFRTYAQACDNHLPAMGGGHRPAGHPTTRCVSAMTNLRIRCCATIGREAEYSQ